MARKANVIREELDRARKVQAAERESGLVQQADAYRSEFANIIKQQKIDEEREKQLDAEKKKALNMHKSTIQAQISKNEEVKKQARLDYLEEGLRRREAIREERDLI